MVKPLPPSRKTVRNSFTPVLIAILIALPLVVLAGLHALLLIMAWLGSSMNSANGGGVGLMSWVLLALATGTTVASAGAAVVGVLLAPRRPRVNSWLSLGIGWCLLAMSLSRLSQMSQSIPIGVLRKVVREASALHRRIWKRIATYLTAH